MPTPNLVLSHAQYFRVALSRCPPSSTPPGALVRTIRSPRGSATAIATHHLLKDVIITANSDCSFSLWDTSSGKEVFNQPFIGYDEISMLFVCARVANMHVSTR